MKKKSSTIVIFLLLSIFLAGCSATKITPPLNVEDGVDVYLLDHGLHTTLILPYKNGVSYRWGYGDFRYYALGEKSFTNSFVALFFPTQAALGREKLSSPLDLAHASKVVKNIYVIHLERVKVYQLQEELLFIFDNATLIHRSEEFSFEFADHPKKYHLFHNSNKMVALWLSSMGAKVSKYPILANWKVEQASK